MKEKHKHSPFSLTPLDSKKQWAIFLSITLIVFLVNVFLEFRHYDNHISNKKPYAIHTQVINQYEKIKNNKSYFVLKLKGENGEIFYTTSKEDIKDLSHRFVRVYGKMGDCSFMQYLQSCFFYSYSISLESSRDFRDIFREFVDSQHSNLSIANLYKTLFIADVLPKVWRDLSNKLGIAHLLAISGFHLSVLSVVIGLIFGFIYSIFHRKFSYRNKYYDIGFFILCVMFFYLFILDFSPSFLRAFVMTMIAFLAIYSGVNLLSFKLLFIVVSVCIALFPKLLFSIGFILSVCGVFFIYLFCSYVKLQKNKLFNILIMPLFFNAAIFLNMLVIVHYFFPYFSPYCLLSIPLSIAFVAFFPLSLLAHFFNIGFIFDDFLLWAMSLEFGSIDIYTPIFLLIPYIFLSFLAIRFYFAYICSLCVGALFFIYACVQFAINQ